MDIRSIFNIDLALKGNYLMLKTDSSFENQAHTNDVFSDKWEKVDEMKENDKLYQFQYEWYLSLYGFKSESDLADYLRTKKVILDAGCGLGYKAAWFAKLAPHTVVIGMDYSSAAELAAKNYQDIPNLYFIRGDIADTHFKLGAVDYVSCDQVIMHTENPEKTFAHLSAITSEGGEFACYVYRKKALPRELLDDYFRIKTKDLSSDELWEMSRQLTQLGKTLSELNIKFVSPDIPLLGIKGGEYDVQRFLYWNFIKCFWKEDWSTELSDATNYDWYSPSNAKRYAEDEFRKMITDNQLTIQYFHAEEACYSGRFSK